MWLAVQIKGQPNRGFTLLELVVGLGLWAILLSGVIGVLLHTGQAYTTLEKRQDAMENARIAIDFMAANLKMADDVFINTEHCGRLILMRAYLPYP